MHNIQNLNGKLVSVTTDGFLTNIENLEDLIINNPICKNNNILLTNFRQIRFNLAGDYTGLELKQISEGIAS